MATTARVSPSPKRSARAARRPSFRHGFVPRPRLVRALRDPAGVALAVIVAPAGYGKTTLLAEWAAHDERPFAWLNVDAATNAAPLLLAGIAGALDEIAPLGPSGAATVERGPPYVLVLDDVQLLHAPAALALLRDVAARIPAGSVLALASRSEPALPLG